VPVSVAAGSAVNVNPRSGVLFALSGTFTASVKFQYSPLKSGDVWFDVGGTLTAAGLVRLPPGRAQRVRANTTAYTSGDPAATILHDRALQALRTEMTFAELDVDVPAEVAAGDASELPDAESTLFSLSGTFVGTVQLQISPATSGNIWFDWGPALTAPAVVWVPVGTAMRIRANTTAYTSGTPSGKAIKGFLQEQTADGESIETVTSGALSLLARTSLISVTDTAAYTIGDGWIEGQRKSLRVTVAGGTPDGTLTPATFADGTSLDLDAVNESVELEWHQADGWNVVHIVGATITA
jgi:hypothetical protein